MTDTMVVISPPVPPRNIGDINYGGSPLISQNRLSEGAQGAQIASMYYNTGTATEATLKWLVEYIKNNDLKDKKIQSVIAYNIGGFCEADKDLVNIPGISPMNAFGSSSAYDYKKENIKEMSGNVTAPVVALAHYLWGGGEERSVALKNIGLKLTPEKLPPVMSVINAGGVGSFHVDGKFEYATAQDSLFTGAYLGNITLRTVGTATIAANGTWSYSGVVRAYNDKYDANPSTHRGALGEMSTTILRYLGGTKYPISIPGEIKVSGSGKR